MDQEESSGAASRGRVAGWATRPGRRASPRALLLLAFVIPETGATALAYWIVAAMFELREPFSPVAIGVIAAWPLGGLLLLIRPLESRLAGPMLGLRLPSEDERVKLERAFGEVCERANESPSQYLLRVEESNELNAVAVGGHLIGVTTRSLTLPEQRLEAVLAHELGHQDGAHSAALAINWWTTLPWRFATGIARIHLALFLLSLPVRAVGLLAYIGQAAAGRAAELEADLFAAELGYGHALAATLRALPARPSAGWLGRLLSTHPSAAERIQALTGHRPR